MTLSPGPSVSAPRGRVLILSVKQRGLLHRLLHRDLHKCSMSALVACQRLGWTLGAGSGYELTSHGRRIAELSEQAPAEKKLELDLH